MEEHLSCKQVKKYFGGLAALDGASLSASKAKTTLLIGPNGSGKTTLINIISGFYPPDSGSIIFETRDITSLKAHERFRLGLVRTFQIPKPFLKLTVLENMMVASRDNPGEMFRHAPVRNSWVSEEETAHRTATRLLDFLKLNHLSSNPSYTLSGGQMKLLEAGRALMSGAKLILMDEPVAGINPVLAHEVLAQLRTLTRDLHVTLVIVEHRLDIALQYVDYVYAMSHGRVVAAGEPKEVMENPSVLESYIGGAETK